MTNDTPEIAPETLETPQTEAEVIGTPVDAEATEQTILHRLKEAGEVGKKEWEQALNKAREFFRQAKDDAEVEGENVAKTALERLQAQSEDLFDRAQTRGADLLLRLITSVRKGSESLEKTLREARERGADEELVVVEAPAAA